MARTRFQALHRPGLILVANQIAKLALSKSGVLYMTQWQIAQAIGEDHQTVAQALRLTYTEEFLTQYGWGFIDQGCGRNGDIHGYKFLHASTANTPEVMEGLSVTMHKEMDHSRSLAAHCEHEARRLGAKTVQGKWYRTTAQLIRTAEMSFDQAFSTKP